MGALGTYSGGGLGMGVAFTLQDQFSQTASHIENSMSRLDGVTDELTRKVNRSMNQMKLGFGMAAAGAALLAPIGKSIMIAADYEQTQIAFETLLGSAEAARAKLEEIKKFSASTPFEFKDVTEMTKRLLAMGIGSKDVMGDLKALGDISSGVGAEKLPLLVLAFGQVKAKGHLAGGELRQFAEAGVPLLDELARMFGVNTEQMGKLIEKGKVGFKDVRTALNNLSSGTGKFSNLMDKQSHSMLGMWSNVKDNLYQAAITIGTMFLPVLKRVVTFIGDFVAKLKEFAQSPFGRWVFKMIAIVGTLLVVLGSLLMLVGAMRFMVFKMAGAFGAATRAQILHTIASKGMAAGLRAIGKAAWAALGPFVIIAAIIGIVVKVFRWLKSTIYSTNPAIMALGSAILFALGPIGWIILAVNWLRRAVQEFNKVGEDGSGKQGGFIGFLQKIGGIIVGVKEAWKSWNDETRTFELGKGLEKKLDALGIKQTVINIGTWIARIKAFLKGIKDAFLEAWTWVKGIVKDAIKAIQTEAEKITGPWDKFNAAVKKNTDSMEMWRERGKKVGKVLLIIVGALIVSFIAMGVVALLLAVVLLIPFVLVGAIIWVIYKAVQALKDKFNELVHQAKSAWRLFTDSFSTVGGAIKKGVGDLYKAGAGMFTRLWQGMKDVWASITGWFSNIGSSISKFFGFGGGDTDLTQKVTQVVTKQEGNVKSKAGEQRNAFANAYSTASNRTASARSVAPTIIHTQETKTEVLNIPIHMDGHKIAEHVIDKTKQKDARRT